MPLDSNIKQYFIVTFNYWMFTLTDSALRMLVLLYFHKHGFSPFELASLFILYEVFGMLTNLFGGWLGARFGLNWTMNAGLMLQIIALSLLTVPSELLSIPLIMLSQSIAGIAKDLNKMSAKSSVKALLSTNDNSTKLYWLVSILTGSKNTLKGIGFFLGGTLLVNFGFSDSLILMAVCLFIVWIASLIFLDDKLGKSESKIKLKHLLAKSREINFLSAARLFLFGARDIWFVVALPVYLYDKLSWGFEQIGSFFAFWVIGYGMIQGVTPKITGYFQRTVSKESASAWWVLLLSLIPFLIAFLMFWFTNYSAYILIVGLCLFGIIFAINSSLHSFLIVNLSTRGAISVDVGFYYMANAAGRLFGTILSGVIYQQFGFTYCLLASGLFLLISFLFSFKLSQCRTKKRAC